MRLDRRHDPLGAYAVPCQRVAGGDVQPVQFAGHAGPIRAAAVLGQNPAHAGRSVVFLASDDDGAAAEIAALAENLGFSPIKLGALAEGGLLVPARGNSWGQLIFKDLVKFD
jgi:hypothetical protein